jgi:hypothetical protein
MPSRGRRALAPPRAWGIVLTARLRTAGPWLAALLVGAAVVSASAATLGGLDSGGLGAGSAPVVACDSNGMTVDYATSGGSVTAITVGGIADPGCEGGQLSLAVQDGGGTAVAQGGPQTVPTDGDVADNSMTVSVSPQPGADQVEGIAIQIAGP